MSHSKAHTGIERPNLFSFATRELSQDAFLCWLLSWHTSGNRSLAAAADALINRLLCKCGLTELSTVDLKKVEVRKQFRSIDVALLLEFSKRTIALLIEDKIDAKLTGNDQLERHIQAFAERRAEEWKAAEKIGEDDIRCVLFKTGFDYDYVCKVKNAFVFNFQDILEWIERDLSRITIENDILADYSVPQKLDR